jgi:Tfp pilus assembly protein PilV
MHIHLTSWESSTDHWPSARRLAAFTLAEVLVSILIVGLSLSAMLSLYVQSAIRSDWSATNLSAQMMALSGLERCRAAKYDPRGGTPIDDLVSSNFPSYFDVLDVGTSSGVLTYGTNIITIRTASTNPLVKLVRVDCTWSYPRRGLYTNSVFTYRAPNQ